MSETSKALFKDALYQVLDNKVFRLLVILVLVLVLPTFLIAAKPEQLELFWGWRTYQYEDVLRWFSWAMPADPSAAHATVIQKTQTFLVEQLAGVFGLVFVIAATAFFVPRMVEKGAADTIFSKPVSRGALLFSRYVAGLLFVAILTTVLVVGMHVGLLLNSGYSDAGFLWAIPVMIYKYAILHAFSLLVAVLTRSSVAAILTTLMFFAFNACVHTGWQVKEMAQERVALQRAAGDEPLGDDPNALIDALLVTLDVVHYTLPKITDATVISQRLRSAIAERRLAYKDPESGLRVEEDPAGMSRIDVSEQDLPTVARWVGGEGTASVTLKRWSLAERKRSEALGELDQRLADTGVVDVNKESDHVLGMRVQSRRWSEARGERAAERQTLFFTLKGYLFSVESDLPVGWGEQDDHRHWEWRFRAGFESSEVSRDPMEMLQSRVGWTAELKYNLWFSIGSTLAFVALTLAFAWWRLSRIDF